MTEILVINPDQPVMEQYNDYWSRWHAQNKANESWLKGRIKHLGYRSMAQFVRENKGITVTAGTVTNYFRGHSTMPLHMIQQLCYALKVTPNDLLTIMGCYDPSRQEIQA